MKTPTLILIAGLVLVSTCFAVDPPPDGAYPNQNTAEGEDALFSLTTGANNTAVGYHALYSITDSSDNTAIGYGALAVSTAGPNTAIGWFALGANTTGINNTAVDGLYSNTTGSNNVAVGSSALYDNTTGSFNTAVGFGALGGNGSNNCAMGEDAMELGGGNDNVAIGNSALAEEDVGSRNVAVGASAGRWLKGKSNILIGYYAGGGLRHHTSDNILIGNFGLKRFEQTISIGQQGTQTAAYLAGVSGVTVADGVEVMVNTNGQLGTMTSSARYKEAIRPMGETSDSLLQLRPVTFHYKKELDSAAIPQFGLVAEEVEKIDPDLVVKDDSGKPYSVRYEAVNAMLLNEFLKEHSKAETRAATIEAQKKKLEQLEAAVTELQSTVEEQAAQLRKVDQKLNNTGAAPALYASEKLN
jgi:uncharacterized coiled-coil protein SlyX